MEYSRTYRIALNNIFVQRWTRAVPGIMHNDAITLNDNIFSKMFIIDVSKDEFEIPMYFERQVCDVLVVSSASNSDLPERIVCKLYPENEEIIRNTSDSIITIFNRVSTFKSILKISNPRGKTYYGQRGIIFNSEFNPILICSMKIKRVTGKDWKWVLHEPTIHVSPEVFLNNDDVLYKHILKKFIPYFLENGVPHMRPFPGNIIAKDIPTGTVPKIVISDMGKYVISPVKPSPNTFSNESLNKILSDNIDEILHD